MINHADSTMAKELPYIRKCLKICYRCIPRSSCRLIWQCVSCHTIKEKKIKKGENHGMFCLAP